MGYHLGIDLGTTFTAAAAMNGGPPTMVALGNRSFQIPSVLYFNTNGAVLVGEAAEFRSGPDPARCAREFKRRIGDPIPIVVGGTPFSPQSLSARLLRWVVDKSTEQLGEAPTDVTLSYPANWTQFKIDLLRQVAVLAEIGTVRACSEPEAAALQYASRAKVAVGDRIAVYDLGGGTFDVCVLEKTPSGFSFPGRPEGIEHLGGIDFDEAVFQQVVDQLPDDLLKAAADDPEEVSTLVRLRRDCVEAKEALSYDVDAVVQVSLSGTHSTVRLTRGEFEDIIRPALEETISATRRALRSAHTSAGQLSAMVLVGGSSRIPLVAEMLTEAFGCPIAVDTHPKNDVAMGAARAVTIPDATVSLTEAAPAPPSSVGGLDRDPAGADGDLASGVAGAEADPPSEVLPAPDDAQTEYIGLPVAAIQIPDASPDTPSEHRRLRWWLISAGAVAVLVIATAFIFGGRSPTAVNGRGGSPTVQHSSLATAAGGVVTAPPRSTVTHGTSSAASPSTKQPAGPPVGSPILPTTNTRPATATTTATDSTTTTTSSDTVGIPSQGIPKVGSCWAGVTATNGMLSGVELPCASPHFWEAYAVGNLDPSTPSILLFDIKKDPVVAKTCNVAVLVKYRLPRTGGRFDLETLPPTQADFLAGHKGFWCLAIRHDRRLVTGSIKDH